MNELHFPWLELLVLLPAVGALWVGRVKDSDQARQWCVAFAGVTFAVAVGAWIDFDLLHVFQAEDHWHMPHYLFGANVLVVDQLSAPLLPLLSLLFFLTALATVRAKARRFSFAWTLAYESMMLAIFSCKESWSIVLLATAGTLPIYFELRTRGRPTRVYSIHMALYICLLILGGLTFDSEAKQGHQSYIAIGALVGAVIVRCGIFPFHCWVSDLFEHATLGSAVLFVTPNLGAYLALRLVLPTAPDWMLHSIGILSLFTAVYAAGMTLIQREARRFFCYLFLSHSALILVGLETATEIGLTGALCVWLSASLALGGFGLTIRALESRRGRLSLTDYQGLYEHTPSLAMCFFLTGLASVGFPGTFGFVGTELLVDEAVEIYPFVGVGVVLAAALNGIAIVKAYFILFTGTRYFSSVSLQIRARERYAVLALAFLIIMGGLVPQPGLASRFQAARALLSTRKAKAPGSETARTHSTQSATTGLIVVDELEGVNRSVGDPIDFSPLLP